MSLAEEEYFVLNVPNKVIELPKSNWSKLDDPSGYAKNYGEKAKSEWHEFNRVVTVFLTPMSIDRRVGLKISEYEYLDFLVVHPGLVTVQTRMDKGKYWVLCRETFKPKKTVGIDISKYKPYLSNEEIKIVWSAYVEEIDETRKILNLEF
jgi:hypothetical protein